jgi:hypothetical protein
MTTSLDIEVQKIPVMQKKSKIIVIGILLMIISGCALAENSDNILIGMWKSDKAKTLAYIKNVYPDVPQKELTEIEKLLGTLIVTFSENEVITDMSGIRLGKGKYRILLVTDSLVVIEDEKDGPIVWYRDGVDSYYLVSTYPYMPREYFKKIK